MIETPLIAINFKTYESSIGERALQLAKACEEAAQETGRAVALCVPAPDIYRIDTNTSIPVLAEHIDAETQGAHTGSILPEDVKENGAIGTLLNHSEHRLRLDVLQRSIERCKEVGLITIVCSNDEKQAKAVAVFEPDFIAVEPPELIGGDISVSTARPELISQTVQSIKSICPSIKVLVGAGVKTGDDVRIAVHLGADGVLLASGITKADNPKQALLDLISGLN
ncbi:triose-phosphate isomerase [Candidatus Woesearchaeota archaeon]|nr:triose-phosphate isomerase [Candidatus Woesearchaeota archaeon]